MSEAPPTAPAHPTYGPWIMYEKLEPPPPQFIIVPDGTPPEAIGLPPGTAPVKGPFHMPSPTPPGGGTPQPPLDFWGPNDPRPSQPIFWPGFPHWPGWPTQPPQPPLVIWGPPDPRPTPPIFWPGFPHWPPTQPPIEPPPTQPQRDGQTPATALYVITTAAPSSSTP
jgi:hypothetical protein